MRMKDFWYLTMHNAEISDRPNPYGKAKPVDWTRYNAMMWWRDRDRYSKEVFPRNPFTGSIR